MAWLRHGAEGVAAALLAALFLTFVAQIVSRYAVGQPLGWTLELCLTLWIWLVFWGNALVVRERDHVTFDILYLAAPPRARQAMAIVSATAVAAGIAAAIPATWDYIDFLRIKRSATLRIPLRTVFSVYALFMVALVLRQLWRLWQLWREGPEPATHHATEVPDQ